MFCCDRLQSSIAAAGQRGIATVIRHEPEGFLFYLQSRAVAVGDGQRLQEQELSVRVNLVCTVGIQFCPWCGGRLEDLADSQPLVFAALAKQHEQFVPSP